MKLLLERWQAYLEEGKAEDIIKKYPNLQGAFDAGIKKPQYLNWMGKRIGDTPIEDAIEAVKNFDRLKAALKSKKKNTDIYSYKTIDDLRDVIDSVGPSRGEQELEAKKETIFVGEFGDWTVEAPLTTKAACHIGKGTTWCTAATKTANLFSRYTESGVILFHLTKKGVDSRKDPTAKINVTFKNGSPYFDKTRGGLTVDAANNGIDEETLRKILGQQYEPIMQAMQAQSDKMEGEHPAKAEKEEKERKKAEETEAAARRGAKDAKFNEEYVKSLRDGDWRKYHDIYFKALIKEDPIPEVMDYYASPIYNGRRDFMKVIQHGTEEFIDYILAKAQESGTRLEGTAAFDIAANPNTSGKALASLVDSEVYNMHDYVRNAVINNEKLPMETTLKILERYIDMDMTPPPRLAGILSAEQSQGLTMVRAIASRKDLAEETLVRLSKYDDAYVQADVAMNKRTPPDTLDDLASSKYNVVKMAVAKNPSTTAATLVKMTKDNKEARGIRSMRLQGAIEANPNYTMAGRAKAGAADLFRRLVREELEAALRERNRRER